MHDHIIGKEVMVSLRKRLEYIQRGGRVQRMHMVPTLQPQNVAAHSFGVAWWCWLLTHEKPSANLLMAALEHDLAEGHTGDIPAPTKHRLGIHKVLQNWEQELGITAEIPVFELTEFESRTLKLADNFELLQHCVRERKLGNRTDELLEMFNNVCAYANRLVVTVLEAEVIAMLAAKWNNS